jgi:uncharacterized membrane protein YhhN
MTSALYLLPLLVVAVFFLIRAELRQDKRRIYVLKPLCTLLVIAMALLSFREPAHNSTYSLGVLVGLLFSFGGDVALMFQEQRKAFMLGLVLFLIGHIAYAIVFGLLGRASALDVASALVLALLGAGFYLLLRPNLGRMRLPVIVYIVVISLMVDRAVSTQASPLFSSGQASMVTAGAALFYISDVILAAARFWKPWPYHRISLAFYYAGQALIALAASYFG